VNFLSIFKKSRLNADIKNRVLKNREGVLDALGQSIKGAKGCPHMMMQKCAGPFCEKYLEFVHANEKGVKEKYWRCADIQTALFTVDNNNLLKTLIKEQRETQKAMLTVSEGLIKLTKAIKEKNA